MLTVEFPQVSARRADFVLRLADEQIYHLELQTNDNEEMDWSVLLQVKMDFKKADMDNKTTKKGTNHVRKTQKKI